MSMKKKIILYALTIFFLYCLMIVTYDIVTNYPHNLGCTDDGCSGYYD